MNLRDVNLRQVFSQTVRTLTSPVAQTSGYRSFGLRWSYNFGERPPFTLLTAELMALDPKVTIATGVRNGLLSQAEVEISGDRPEIMEFVAAQWRRLWTNEATKLLEIAVYGYGGFENMFRNAPTDSRWGRKIVFDSLFDFHPRDVRPLVRRGQLVGMTVAGVKDPDVESHGLPYSNFGSGKRALWGPKALWLTYESRYGNWFGRSMYEKAHAPWWEKTQEGGAIKLRQLRMIKDAWIGDVFWYPKDGVRIADGTPGGTLLGGRDLVREIGELRKSGGIIGLPLDYDANGNKRFDYQGPTSVQGATQIFEYTKELDSEILEALETPGEMLEAMSSGSGFSGRSIPLLALLATLQLRFADLLRQIDRQILRPLVRLNYGVEPQYEITPKSLMDVIVDKLGDSSVGGGAMSGGDDPNRRPTMGLAAASPRLNSPLMQRAFDSARQFADNSYRPSRSCVTILSPRATYEGETNPLRARSFVSPSGGALVGGIYYPEGRLVSVEAIRFASDDEIAAFPPQSKRTAVGRTFSESEELQRFKLFSGSRRELMSRLSVEAN